MASEMLQRPDLSVYIVAGLPKNFVRKLREIVHEQSDKAEVMQVDPDMTDWVVARLRGEKRRAHEQTPASAALWRAYSALSAARYHMQDRPEEEQIRALRRTVEELWREVSPLFEEKEEAEENAGAEEEGDGEETGEKKPKK